MNKIILPHLLNYKQLWITSIIIVFFCTSCKKNLNESSITPPPSNLQKTTSDLNGKWKIISSNMVKRDLLGKVLLKDSTGSSTFFNFNNTHLNINNINFEYEILSKKNNTFLKYNKNSMGFLFEIKKITSEVMILEKKETLSSGDITSTITLNKSNNENN